MTCEPSYYPTEDPFITLSPFPVREKDDPPTLEVTTCSRVLVVYDGKVAMAFYFCGDAIENEVDSIGGQSAEDLGIVPEKPGIWVWEGTYQVTQCRGYEYADCDIEPVGTHRPPTPEEWSKIMRGLPPWETASVTVNL